MDAFATLSRRGQLSRLRRLGRTALASYGLEGARLTLQRLEHNTSFRVDASHKRYLLRINRPQVHTADTIASEMAWLTPLRRDADLPVPEPVAALNGSLVVLVHDPGVPEIHACVLLRWLDGRFVDQRLAPVHLRRVGTLAGEHRRFWPHPRRPPQRKLPVPSSEVREIDFHDCGWGFHLYDLAVRLCELQNRTRYRELLDGLFEAYAKVGRLPEDHVVHLNGLFVLRRMQILLWVLESREQATFRDKWQRWARDEMDAIASAIAAEQIAARTM